MKAGSLERKIIERWAKKSGIAARYAEWEERRESERGSHPESTNLRQAAFSREEKNAA